MSYRINRRNFLSYIPFVFATTKLVAGYKPIDEFIMTVTGPIQPRNLGSALPHEHILVDFIGADKISAGRYDEKEVFKIVLPYLQSLKQLGCKSMMECTPNYLGRNVQLLQKLSVASGIQIITNTGLYGAAGEKYLPAFVQQESPDQLAARWINEYKNGIDGTGIKPGFLKSGVDKGPLTISQRKLIEAAAITWFQTGLPICVHTGDGAAALEEADILKAKGVPLDAWIWVHAQNEKDINIHTNIASSGGWISFDGLSEDAAPAYLKNLTTLKNKGLLNKVLISHDAGWYHVGETNGGEFRNYSYLFSTFIPMLQKNGFTNDDIQLLTVSNPAKAFAISMNKI